MRVDVEKVSNSSAVEALWALGGQSLKRGESGQTRGVGGVEERVPKTAPQKRRFLPHNHRYRDLCGEL